MDFYKRVKNIILFPLYPVWYDTLRKLVTPSTTRN